MLDLQEAKNIYLDFISNEDKKPRLDKLFKYYNAKHKILDKHKRLYGDTTKIVNNYAKYISTMATGYFIGVPIKYSSTDEDIEEINKIFKMNYETSHNADIALNMSIYGVGYELDYLDEDSNYNFASIDPRCVIVKTDGNIKPKITDAIIIDEEDLLVDNKLKITLSIYDDTECVQYTATANKYTVDNIESSNFKEIDRFNHKMGQCPIIEYRNNLHKKSDFEDVISLIDAYNEATSTSIDDLKDFTDAFLKLKNYTLDATPEEDETEEDAIRRNIEALKESKIFFLDENGDASWLEKNINDTYAENIKNRLKQDIHKFAFCPDLTDEAFAGNVTGIAIKFKFQALEQLRQEKERYFTKGLFTRFTLINNYLEQYHKEVELYNINIRFQANLPVNIDERVKGLVALTGIISRKTQLANIPYVENVDQEIKELENEKNDFMDNVNFQDILNKAEKEEDPKDE